MAARNGGPGTGFVPGRGNLAEARLIYIGEAPGADEVAWRRCPRCGGEGTADPCTCGTATVPFPSPFVGRSGKLAAHLMRQACLDQLPVYRTNVLKCRPPDNKYPTGKLRAAAEAHCSRYLAAELAEVNRLASERGRWPVVVAAGARATEALLDGRAGASITETRGYVYATTLGDGSVSMLLSRQGLTFLPPAIPTIHPSFLFRGLGRDAESRSAGVSPLIHTVWDYSKARRIAQTQQLRRPISRVSHSLAEAVETISPELARTSLLGLDLEWDVDTGRITVVGLGAGEHAVAVWFDGPRDGPVLASLLANPNYKLAMHNGLQADLLVLERHRLIGTAEALLPRVQDTMVMAHLAYPDERSGLDFWGSLCTDMPYWKHLSEVGNLAQYCTYDTYGALATHEVLAGELGDLDLLPLLPTQQACQLLLARLSVQGLTIRRDRVEPAISELEAEMARLSAGPLRELENPRSSPQVQEFFRQRHGRLPHYRGRETADRHALEKLAERGDEAASAMLAYRSLQVAVSRYLRPYLEFPASENGLATVRTELSLTRSGTGRIQSREPNLLQIPKESEMLRSVVRSLYVPSQPGWLLLEADWKQIEALLVYHFAGCEELKRALMDATRDIHTEHAAKFGTTRAIAKRATHGTHYMATAGELAYRCRLAPKEVARVQSSYLATNPEIPRWWKQVERTVLENRGILRLPFGRIRRFYGKPEVWLKEAVATLPQGTVADMLIRVLLRVEAEMRHFSGRLLLPIHDALLLEGPPDEIPRLAEMLQDVMGCPWPELGGLRVGVEFKAGSNWAELTPLAIYTTTSSSK